MEEKKIHLDSPFISVKRFPTKPENSNESKNTKKKTTTRRKVKDSCKETEHETLLRLLQENHSLNHVMRTSSIPFNEESDLIKALGMVSSTASFRVHEFKKNEERLRNLARHNTILENRDLLMSIAMKESSLVEEYKKKKKRSIALQRVSMAIKQDLQNVDDDDDNEDHSHVYSNVSKKALFGLCSKNSVDVLLPILSRVKTCQNLGVKPERMVNPKPLNSVNKIRSSSSSSRILRSNQVMTKSQELYPKPRFAKEISKVCLSDPGDIIRTPKQRTRSINQIQRRETRFLEEEVKRRRNVNKFRSGNFHETSVSQLPMPKTPSESWLCRTLPRISAASVVSGQAAGFKKMMMDQKTNPQSIKWETIVKTSYKHHAHVRYSEEHDVVNRSRQSKS